MRILLTGAAGFIGSHLAERLTARGDQVIGFDNFDAFYPRSVKQRNLAALGSRDNFSLVEVPDEYADKIIDAMRGTKIRGVAVKVRREKF